MNISSPLRLVKRGVLSRLTSTLRVSALPCAVGLAMSSVSTANAAWSLYQNFQGLPAGYNIADNTNPNENFTVATQNSASPAGGYTVIVDPTNSGNKLLEMNATSMAFSGQFVDAATGTPTPILNLTTGTLFYRIYRESVSNTPDVNFGGADQGPVTNGVNNADKYQSQLNVSGGSVVAGTTDIFRPRNGGGTVDTGVHWSEGSWFGIYQVIDTTTNTSVFYYQGESDLAPIRLQGVSSGTFNMAFRNGASRGSTDIAYFLATNGLPGGGVNDIFYLDDIYLDVSGANLVGPVSIVSVPEPSVYGFVLVTLCGVAALARRRHRSV